MPFGTARIENKETLTHLDMRETEDERKAKMEKIENRKKLFDR